MAIHATDSESCEALGGSRGRNRAGAFNIPAKTTVKFVLAKLKGRCLKITRELISF